VVETRRLNELGAAMLSRARWPTPPYRIALSGGADSAALASLALLSGNEFDSIHIHHGLPGSDLMADAAADIATSLGISMTVIQVEVGDGPSPEAQARDARYAAIDEQGTSPGSVLVGHTRDDQAETVLLNLIRGTGLQGLGGIRYHREPNIYRPLLEVSRAETREYAALSGLRYRDDPTNFDRSIRRNWVRLELIPMLQKANPAVVASLSQTAGSIRLAADFVEGETPAVSPGTAGHSIDLAIGDLVAVPDPIRWLMLGDVIERLRGSPGLERGEMARISDVIEQRSSGTELEGGLRVRREGPYVRIVKE
jgi:tRNA(Ile)-lysidine synthase